VRRSVGGERASPKEERLGVAMVVVRATLMFSVSADGGGGRPARREARQRKHSPLPKKPVAGRGYSDR
jgi:hypothetical protein